MIMTLVSLALLFLFLYLIYWAVGHFVNGVPLQILGIILALVFLVKALAALGIAVL